MRELAEETTRWVGPTDLKFVSTDYEPIDDDHGVVSILFAAPSSRVHGEPVAGDDAAEVCFWRRVEIAENPYELRAGDVTPVLHAVDTLGRADDVPL